MLFAGQQRANVEKRYPTLFEKVNPGCVETIVEEMGDVTLTEVEVPLMGIETTRVQNAVEQV